MATSGTIIYTTKRARDLRRHRAWGVPRIVYRLFCEHTFRQSRSWPGVAVCRKCGLRRGLRSMAG